MRKNIQLLMKFIPTKVSSFYLFLTLVSIFLFIIFIPLSLKIDFMQNDDFVHYKIMEFLVKGDLFLVTELGATFIAQGLLSLPFAYFFGIQKLPIFTLLISISNFIIFSIIVKKFYLKKNIDSIIIGLLFFSIPIHIYSSLGFMMENYFMFFMLLAIYFYKEFEKDEKIKNLIIFNFFVFLSFMVRQFGFIISLSLSFYFLLQKKYKLFILEFGYSSFIYLFYIFIFPRTPEMLRDGRVNFEAFLSPESILVTISTYLLYLAAFSIPLIIGLLISKNFYKNIYFWVGCVIGLLLIISLSWFYKFGSEDRYFSNLFYLKNTVSRTGYIFTDRLGDIPEINLFGTVFDIWDILAKFSLALLIGFIFINKKQLTSYFSILISVYILSQIPLSDVYDRYTLFIIPIGILLILEFYQSEISKFTKYLILIYLIVVCSFNYQASMRFVFAGNSMWNKAINISESNKISRSEIMPGYPWFKIYRNKSNYDYIFSFSKNNSYIDSNYKLKETVSLDFPLNLYGDSNYYIYKRE